MLRPILQDIRFSFRTVRSAPWISLVTVLTLALGIGASVSMFSVLDSVFLRPLPFPEADRLVVGRTTVQGLLNPWVTGADYYDYRDESEGFEELAAVLPFPVDLTVSGAGDAERVSGNVAAPNLLPALGVSPVLGRAFRPEDGLEGAEDVVILSHGFWQRQLGGDPQVLGTSLTVDGSPFTVVGVLPPSFFFMTPADLWLPMRPDRFAAASRDMHNWYLVGHLRPEVTLDQAQAGVDIVAARLREAYPDTNRDKGLLLSGLRDVLTEDYRQSLWILTGAILLVLLIACGNGAGILLARAPARRFELSVRAAMGAPRGRLVRQLLGESLGLALAGGMLGTALALWLQRMMLDYLRMERLGPQEAGLSLPVLGAALGISMVAGLLAGVYPALKSTDVSLTDGLKAGGRGVGDGGAGFRSGLVVAQVALSVILLAASGLLVRSLSNLQSLDPGFEAGGILTAEVQVPQLRYPDAPSRTRYFTTLLEEIWAIPGVESATLTSHLPIGDFGNIYRASAPGTQEEPQRVFLRSVFPGYFETLGIPLMAGREVEAEDQPESPFVVILSQTAAQRLFPGEDPLGKTVELGLVPASRPMEVVGIVGDVRLSRLDEEPEAALYVPYAHRPRPIMRVALRTRTPPEAAASALGEIVRGLDPEVPLSRVATLESLVSGSMAERRVITVSLTLLALLPLILAAVGLFAVLAYHVSRQRHEMGVRMALGADAAQVGGLILRRGLGLVTVGTFLGLAGALAWTRVLQGMLFGVGATDPITFLAVAGLVLAVAVLASGVPVWRAARCDPREALQAE
jgi:putative ABC transport system permease protein